MACVRLKPLYVSVVNQLRSCGHVPAWHWLPVAAVPVRWGYGPSCACAGPMH